MEAKTNVNVTIDNIQFIIKRIYISQEYNKPTYFPNEYQKTIRLLTETSTQNYMKISNWFDVNLNKPKKNDLIFNSLKFYSVFPIDYDFSQHCINVTFSADYYEGNLKLFEIQQLRKQKLLKINESK